uniref:MaoC-like domain-containing protein n=1 Tax=Chenopodium quinoa TaxID=63459 RepID=A0A803MX38_CHEQI
MSTPCFGGEEFGSFIVLILYIGVRFLEYKLLSWRLIGFVYGLIWSICRDAALYALGVGACGTNAVDANELKYVYHGDGQQFIKIRNTTRVAGLHDKGKAAILEIEMTSFDEDSKEPLCMNRSTIYFRGAGGFSRSSPPYTFTNYSGTQLPAIKIPKSQPFASFEDVTRPSQALLYRLSGDYNPLHSDPMVAETAGFPRPILHGLCSLGYAIRAIIKCICKGNSDMVKSLSGRFLLHVFPGETLITEMWLEGLRVIYQVNVKERNKVVLSGHVDLNLLPSHL